jgi:hypothetical protein
VDKKFNIQSKMIPRTYKINKKNTLYPSLSFPNPNLQEYRAKNISKLQEFINVATLRKQLGEKNA